MPNEDLFNELDNLQAACTSFQNGYSLTELEACEEEDEIWDLTEDIDRLCQRLREMRKTP